MKKLPKKKTPSKTKPIFVNGIIYVHSKGFAFVSPENSKLYPEDIFIPKHLKGNAVDGDLVKIAVQTKKHSTKGPEGSVISVLERAKKHLVGIVWMINPKGNYVLYIQSLGKNKSAIVKKTKGMNYQIGDRLLLNISEWGDENNPALCTVEKELGSLNNPHTDIPAAILDFNIRKSFPKSVMDQVKQFSTQVEKDDLKDRIDLTNLETFTIDPDTAKDFDDALSLSQDKNGYFHLAVHIADVAYYIDKDTPLDIEAKLRSNSTYFPGECVPMIPEELSNHLCSLKEKVIRLTISVLIEMDHEGNTIDYKIVRGFIKSQTRFTYKKAKDVLDKKVKNPHFSTLKRMEKLCLLLKEKRCQRGSVDLALNDIVIQIDKKGTPYGYEEVKYDITHQLVEEFMLKANEIVAQDFIKNNIRAVFRVHESPSPDTLNDFYILARSLGFSVPNDPSNKDIQQLFNLAKKTPYAHQLSVAYIRSMKLAFYSDKNLGHYGLALDNYCHFTSPIRRYSDLVIHRLLFDKTHTDNLEEISKQCSEKERISFKAEMNVLGIKKLRLLKIYQEKDPKRIYEGIVSKVKPFGIFFDVSPIKVEGFLHVSQLDDDYYHFQDKIQALVGKNIGKLYKIGDKIKISLESINLILMETKWICKKTNSR